MPTEPTLIPLESLLEGIPAISPNSAGFYQENCMVCLDRQGHESGVILNVIDSDGSEHKFKVCWSCDVTPQLKRNFADTVQNADKAACALAMLLVREMTECTAVEQSIIGTAVDYWLSPKDELDDDLIFNHSARLEVSGINHEEPSNTVRRRVNSKRSRLISYSGKDRSLPTLIVVVEFSRPWSKIECYQSG